MAAIVSLTQSEFSAGKPITDSPSVAKPPSRAFARYSLAICIGVAATLTWQSYGQSIKEIVATRASDLGWSPEVKQTIAGWVAQLGWTKSPENAAAPSSVPETAHLGTVEQTALNKIAAKMPIAPSLDPQQVQQLSLDLAALRHTVEQVAASQTKIQGEIDNLLVTDMEIFLKIPTPPQPPAASSRKQMQVTPPSRAPNHRTDLTHNQSLTDIRN